MHRVAGHLNEAQVAVPAHIVQSKIQALALAARQIGAVDIEHLAGGMFREFRIHQQRAGLGRTVGGADQFGHLQRHEMLALGF